MPTATPRLWCRHSRRASHRSPPGNVARLRGCSGYGAARHLHIQRRHGQPADAVDHCSLPCGRRRSGDIRLFQLAQAQVAAPPASSPACSACFARGLAHPRRVFQFWLDSVLQPNVGAKAAPLPNFRPQVLEEPKEPSPHRLQPCGRQRDSARRFEPDFRC